MAEGPRKALVDYRLELRLDARAYASLGVAYAAVTTIFYDDRLRGLPDLAIALAIFALFFWWLGRRACNDLRDAPAAPEETEPETADATRRKAVRRTLGWGALGAFVILVYGGEITAVAGIWLVTGAYSIVMGRWLAEYECETGARILRERRLTWKGPLYWRGAGVRDPVRAPSQARTQG